MRGFPLLLAHRGAHAAPRVPENTIVSFDRALEDGCDGFEFDLRLTKCGRAVVCHNPRVGGLTVSRATCRQLVQLPQLEDVLRHYGQGVFLDIELKVRGLEPCVLDALRDHAPRNYVVSSAIPDVVMELKARSGVVPVGIICEKPRQLVRWPDLPVEYVIVQHALITRRLVNLVHNSDRKLLAWTVNDRRAMVRLASWNVDGIISDQTQLLVETLAKTPRVLRRTKIA